MPGSDCRVFLGGLSNRASEGDVERFFKGFGRIRNITLKNGYGFVEFEDARDADDAIYEMNNQSLCGSRVSVERSHGGERPRYGGERRGPPGGGRRNNRPYNTEWRVIVENLSSRCGWQDLKDHLRAAGEVTYAEAHQYIRGEGMVDFATKEDMRIAIDKLDQSELYGRRIRLIEDKSQRRSVSRSASRSPVRRSRSPLDRRSPLGDRRASPMYRSRSPDDRDRY